MKQISGEEIELIKKLLLKRNAHKEIKDILDNLEKVKDETKDKIRRLIRERGRSRDNISIEEIENLIGNY